MNFSRRLFLAAAFLACGIFFAGGGNLFLLHADENVLSEEDRAPCSAEFCWRRPLADLDFAHLTALKTQGFHGVRVFVPQWKSEKAAAVNAELKTAEKIAELWQCVQGNVASGECVSRITLDFTVWDTHDPDTVTEFLKTAFSAEDFRVNAPAELAVAVGSVPQLAWDATDAESAKTLKKTWETLWTSTHADQFSLRFGYPLEPFLPVLFASEKVADEASQNVAGDVPPEVLACVRNDVNRLLAELYGEKILAPLGAWCQSREVRLQFCFMPGNAGNSPGAAINRMAEMEAARHANEMCALAADALPYARSIARVEGRLGVFQLSTDGRSVQWTEFSSETGTPDERRSDLCLAVVAERDTHVYKTLRENGAPCDFIPPQMLAEGTVTRIFEVGEKTYATTILGVGPAEYHTLILHEDVTALTPEAAAFLLRFARRGGKILVFCATETACAEKKLPESTGSLYRAARRNAEVQKAATELRSCENPPQWVREI